METSRQWIPKTAGLGGDALRSVSFYTDYLLSRLEIINWWLIIIEYIVLCLFVKDIWRKFVNQVIIAKKREGTLMSIEWLSVDDIAKELDLTEDTIRNYIRTKQLVAVRIGNTYRIKREDLNRFLEERKTKKDDEK